MKFFPTEGWGETSGKKSMVLLGQVKQGKDYSKKRKSKWMILEMIKSNSRIVSLKQRYDLKYKDAA